MMAPDPNPVNGRVKSRTQMRRKSNKAGGHTKDDVEATATVAAQNRAVKAAPTLVKRDAQTPVTQNQRKANAARIADEAHSAGKATEASRIAHRAVPTVEAAATTDKTDVEAK